MTSSFKRQVRHIHGRRLLRNVVGVELRPSTKRALAELPHGGTMAELKALTPDEFLRLPGAGPERLREVQQAIRGLGIKVSEAIILKRPRRR